MRHSFILVFCKLKKFRCLTHPCFSHAIHWLGLIWLWFSPWLESLESASLCLSSLRTPSEHASSIELGVRKNFKGLLEQCFLHLWTTEFRIQRSQLYRKKKFLNRNKSRRIQIQIRPPPSTALLKPWPKSKTCEVAIPSLVSLISSNASPRCSPGGPSMKTADQRGTQSSDWATIKSLIGFGRQILTSPHTFLLACDPERGTDIWRMPRALDSFPQHHTEHLLISIMARCSSMW